MFVTAVSPPQKMQGLLTDGAIPSLDRLHSHFAASHLSEGHDYQRGAQSEWSDMPSAALPASCFKARNLFREEENWEKAWKIRLNHTKPREDKKKWIWRAQAKPVAHSIISWRCSLGRISPIVTIIQHQSIDINKKNLSKSYLYFPKVVLYIQTLSHCVVVKIKPLILDGKGKSLIWFH